MAANVVIDSVARFSNGAWEVVRLKDPQARLARALEFEEGDVRVRLRVDAQPDVEVLDILKAAVLSNAFSENLQAELATADVTAPNLHVFKVELAADAKPVSPREDDDNSVVVISLLAVVAFLLIGLVAALIIYVCCLRRKRQEAADRSADIEIGAGAEAKAGEAGGVGHLPGVPRGALGQVPPKPPSPSPEYMRERQASFVRDSLAGGDEAVFSDVGVGSDVVNPLEDVFAHRANTTDRCVGTPSDADDEVDMDYSDAEAPAEVHTPPTEAVHTPEEVPAAAPAAAPRIKRNMVELPPALNLSPRPTASSPAPALNLSPRPTASSPGSSPNTLVAAPYDRHRDPTATPLGMGVMGPTESLEWGVGASQPSPTAPTPYLTSLDPVVLEYELVCEVMRARRALSKQWEAVGHKVRDVAATHKEVKKRMVDEVKKLLSYKIYKKQRAYGAKLRGGKKRDGDSDSEAPLEKDVPPAVMLKELGATDLGPALQEALLKELYDGPVGDVDVRNKGAAVVLFVLDMLDKEHYREVSGAALTMGMVNLIMCCVRHLRSKKQPRLTPRVLFQCSPGLYHLYKAAHDAPCFPAYRKERTLMKNAHGGEATVVGADIPAFTVPFGRALTVAELRAKVARKVHIACAEHVTLVHEGTDITAHDGDTPLSALGVGKDPVLTCTVSVFQGQVEPDL